MKSNNYTIRLTDRMRDFIVEKSREMQLLPSEYLRLVIEKEIEYDRKNKIIEAANNIIKENRDGNFTE